MPTETAEEARERRFTGGEVDSPTRNLARYIDRMADLYVPNLDTMMVYRLDRFGRDGHHRRHGLGENNANGLWAYRTMRATHDSFARPHLINHSAR